MTSTQMEVIQKKLTMLNYSQANAPAQSLLFAGMERYALLEWLFFRLLGDKSPFSQQNIQGDALDGDEETALIQHLAEIAKFLDITTTVDTEAIQGHGSYEERAEMLRHIVDLVEVTIHADNPEWSIDEQVAKDIQLIDSIAEKQAQIFSEEYKLFPPDFQIQSIYPMPDVSELESKLSEQSKILLNLHQKVDDLASKHAYNPYEEYAEVESQLRAHLQSFLQTAKTFNLIYTKITMATNTSGNLSLQSLLENDKLSITNFPEWYSNLRIVLKHEKKLYVLEQKLPELPAATAPKADKDAYKKHFDDAHDIGCLMLATMNSELQKQHENMEAYDMIMHLKMLYKEQARYERIEVSRALFRCKLAEGNPVGPHVLQMIGYIENLERLGYPLGLVLATDLILQSLPDSYSQLVMNYIMNNIYKTLPELASMLRTAEQILKKGKGKTILMVQNGNEHKDMGKKKFKPSTSSLKPVGGVTKKGTCFHCGQIGHWKRNCTRYLEECKKRKVSDASIKEIRPWTHMMEVPQLHGFGPAASRLLEAYKMLLKFLRNLRNLRDSHGALAFGYSETSEGPSSVTKIISECESALTDLNRGLRILSTSIARQQGEKMST
ncbi:AUGMIN subunit 7-like isoform X1 [Trifolium pratense]|nr:AUGMIN subunit 7-like isoform X1 [Trifolium pratense]